MYDLTQPTATTSSSSLYRPSIDDSEYLSLQEKGKGREEYPSLLSQARASYGKSKASSSSLSRDAAVMSSRHSQRNNQSNYSPSSSSPADSNCAQTPTETSPLSVITSLTPSSTFHGSSSSLEKTEATKGCESRGASMSGCCARYNQYGSFSCTSVSTLEDVAHTAAENQMSRLGLRRRPYQSGIAPIVSQSSNNEIMSENDRNSIFSGLNLDLNFDLPATTRYSTFSDTIDPMASSSIKRSFEEAISPSPSPRTQGRDHTQGDQESNRPGPSSILQSSRAFTSSVSHPIVSLRESDHVGPSIGHPDTQSARRRIPYKRRRAASLEASSDMDACLVSFNRRSDESDYPLTADDKRRLGPSSSSSRISAANSENNGSRLDDANASERVREGENLRREIAQQAIDDFHFESDPGSIAREATTMGNNVDSFSGTMNLLQRWWVDTEDTLEVRSSGRQDDLFEGSSSAMRDVNHSNSISNQCDAVGVSSAISPVGHDSNITQSVLRHLQYQERSESDDVNVEQNNSNGMRYHDELMDVFRRLSEDANNNLESVRPVMPPRSSTMYRSTTQISDTSRYASNDDFSGRRINRETTASHIGYEDARERPEQGSLGTSTTLLPSARAYETQLSRVNQERQTSIQSQVESYQELARRNQEVLLHYADNPSGHRIRHSGSPTFPEDIYRNIESSSLWNDNRSSNDENEQREALYSTTRVSTAADNPQRDSSPRLLTTRFQDEERRSSRLWGEYLESRTTREDATTSHPDIGGLSEETFEFLFPTFGRHLNRQDSFNPPLSNASGMRRRNAAASTHDDHVNTSLFRSDESRLGLNEYRSRASRLEDEAMVMSTYRQMSFPDPEATLGLSSSAEAPQLPSLPSSSPLISPLDDGMGWTRRDLRGESMWPRNSPSQTPIRTESYRDFQLSRPSLRPLTLTSRLADRTAAATIDSPTMPTSSATENSFAQIRTSHRRRPFSSVEDHRRDVITSRQSQFHHSREEVRNRLGGRSPRRREEDVRQRHRVEGIASSFTSQLPRGQHSREDSDRQSRQRAGVSSSMERRWNTLDDTSTESLRPRESRSNHTHVPNSPSESNQAGVIGSRSRAAEVFARSSRPYLPFTRFGPRLSSRYDRYLEEIGSAIGARSTTQQQIQQHRGEGSSSSSTSLASMLTSSSSTSTNPSLFNLSRFPSGSNFATSTRSEIAMNPANYVADDDFALRDTYEGLLQLSAQIGEVRCRATPAHVIDKLPICLYHEWIGGNCSKTFDQEQDQDNLIGKTNKGKAKAKEDYNYILEQRSNRDTTCSICLETYQASDSIMSLPCDHAFHQGCVTTWLKTARSCPCCRGNVCSEEVFEKGASSMQSSFTSVPWHRLLPELNF